MSRKLKDIMVELRTPKGLCFSGGASSIELRTTDGLIAINPQEESYLSLVHTTAITLRCGTEFRRFLLKNATASLRSGKLTVLAEHIISVEPTKSKTSEP
jgi:F0F1-type ATP synthase epsilon subunit